MSDTSEASDKSTNLLPGKEESLTAKFQNKTTQTTKALIADYYPMEN